MYAKEVPVDEGLDKLAESVMASSKTPASSSNPKHAGARVAPAPQRIDVMSTSGVASMSVPPVPKTPRREHGRALPYLLSMPALLDLRGHPHSVRNGGLVLAAALQSRVSDDPEVHLVRQLHFPVQRRRVLAHRPRFDDLHRSHGRAGAAARARHRDAAVAPHDGHQRAQRGVDAAADGRARRSPR